MKTDDIAAGAGSPSRVTLSMNRETAEAIDDSLTVGRGRERGKALTGTEKALREAVRKGLKDLSRREKAAK